MKKVTDFLEKHVQWITLGLALLYILYMGYAYIYTAPISVVVGSRPATPGDIDPKIVEGPVRALEDAIKDKKVDAPKVTDVLKSFDEKIAEKKVSRSDLAMNIGSTQQPVTVRSAVAAVGAGPVTNLPNPPPATPATIAPIAAQWTVAMKPGKGGAAERMDVAYVKLPFTVDMAELTKAIGEAFSKGKVAANLLNAEFVRVEVYREERLPNGQWDAPKLIPPLAIDAIQPWPGDAGKNPANQKDQQDWFVYENWAQKSQDLLTQPPFYPTAPDAPKVNLSVSDPGPAAAAPGAPPTPPAPNNALINPNAGNAPNPGNPAPGGGPLNPALVAGNLQLIINDDSLKEGKTYRYAVRYRLYNPFYTKPALATKEIAEKFDYASPDPTDPKTKDVETLWTGPVTPEPRSYIFVQKITPFRNEAQFSVFVWRDGHWRESNPNKLSPGDPVSGYKGESRWTLVDVRKDPRSNEAYVIVMDDEGALQQRDEKTDGADPMLVKLKAQGGAPAPTRAGAPPARAGAPALFVK